MALATGDDIEHPEELPLEDQVEKTDRGYGGEKVEDAPASTIKTVEAKLSTCYIYT